jgi:hypothetical protein
VVHRAIFLYTPLYRDGIRALSQSKYSELLRFTDQTVAAALARYLLYFDPAADTLDWGTRPISTAQQKTLAIAHGLTVTQGGGNSSRG